MEDKLISKTPQHPLPNEEDRRLPPRRIIHSQDNSKATRIFHASLLVLLLLLTGGMIFWYTMYGEY